jgi:hypothetical protein
MWRPLNVLFRPPDGPTSHLYVQVIVPVPVCQYFVKKSLEEVLRRHRSSSPGI